MSDLSMPALPCPRCGRCCDFADQDEHTCAGTVRAYYLDPETRRHVCEWHYPLLTDVPTASEPR